MSVAGDQVQRAQRAAARLPPAVCQGARVGQKRRALPAENGTRDKRASRPCGSASRTGPAGRQVRAAGAPRTNQVLPMLQGSQGCRKMPPWESPKSTKMPKVELLKREGCGTGGAPNRPDGPPPSPRGEASATGEGVLSIFEPPTRGISNGQMGRPVARGVPGFMVEDPPGFRLHHEGMREGDARACSHSCG